MDINYGFWAKLPRPFFVQAPMADVTDCVFRQVIAECGKPDVLFTEFVSTDGLMHPDGREKLLVDLRFSEIERPIVAQIFGSKPENFHETAKLIVELGFDGVDINMGCPVKVIGKQGAGASLIKPENRELAKEIILATKEGAGDLPVSVKTRIGYNKVDEFDDWMSAILETKPAVITMHLRTQKEMSKVPAHWELAHKMREIVGDEGPLLVGNGDVADISDAKQKAKEANLDGVMLGRAIYGNPWLYLGKSREEISWKERLDTVIAHTNLYEKTFISEPKEKGLKPYKGFAVMRKFYGAYVSGHPQAKQFREALMECESAKEVEEVVERHRI